jgi:hypothetical protein
MKLAVFFVLVANAAIVAGCGGTSGPTPMPVAPVPTAPSPTSTPTPTTPGSPVVMPGVQLAQSRPADLTIRYVERLPAIGYVLDATDPTTQGWPEKGSVVTWRAHLRNWTSTSMAGVDYVWTLDGVPAASGSFSVGQNTEASLDFPWPWERTRHRLELRVDASNRFTVPGGPRNHILIDTDALAVGLYVEQGVYDYFRQHQAELRIGNSSFDDWAQLQVELWNLIFERATYADSPQGVLDRVRIDAVHLVPDGSLPLDPLARSIGGSFDPPQARPNVGDTSVDLEWGFPLAEVTGGIYNDTRSLATNNQFYYSGFIQHEMGHARYLVDVYPWDVYDGTAGSSVELTEGGVHVAGSRYMPGTPATVNGVPGIQVHRTPHQGLMNSDWRYVDDYSAAALNLIAGRRAVDGNYNEPANLGAFLNDLPRDNQVTLRDPSGRPLSNARVQVFQSTPGDSRGQYYTKLFDATPDLERQADAQGQVRLGQNPFSNDGPVRFVDASANGTIILRVEQGGQVGYAFLESSDFNMEYWRGHLDLGQYSLILTLF